VAAAVLHKKFASQIRPFAEPARSTPIATGTIIVVAAANAPVYAGR
jgi:hypothetical protein